MNLKIYTNNLLQLKKKDPVLAEKVDSIETQGRYSVKASKKGPPSLFLNFVDGKKITVHSTYDPVKEAGQFIDQCDIGNVSNFIVLGLGLGYHIQELLYRVAPTSKIIIFEKDLECLFCCLANIDFTAVIGHPGIQFQIGVDSASVENVLEPDRMPFSLSGYSIISFKPLVNADKEYFSDLLRRIDALFDETQLDLNTKAAFSKKFYSNIFENWKHIISSSGIHFLENKYHGIPAIIVSAGPSLDKNIRYLKECSNRVLVIAVATAFRPLVKNNITVDFVVAVDPDESTLQFFDFEKIPGNTWLVFDPCVPSAVVDLFPDRKIRIDSGVCLSRWLASRQGEDNFLGKTYSVAHAAFLMSRFFGCNPIMLTGQDLSFNQRRLHCADSYYDQARKDKIGAQLTLKMLEDEKYNEFSDSYKSTRNIFNKDIVTTTALNTYKEVFADKVGRQTSVYNTTEGGLPISGIPNMTLSEAINKFCGNKYRHKINCLPVEAPRSMNLKKMHTELIQQYERFHKIDQQIKKIKSICTDRGVDTEGQVQNFLTHMDELYLFLLKQTETLQLMQGYSYMEFIEWNQESNKIAMKESIDGKTEVIDAKYHRDKKFLDVLEETADFLRTAFMKMASEIP